MKNRKQSQSPNREPVGSEQVVSLSTVHSPLSTTPPSSILKTKSFAFALRIIKLYQHLQSDKKEYIMSKQILRSGTAVGALVREAEQAESKADFIHKLSIALKEANESEYWLELLHQSGYIAPKGFQSIHPDLIELLKILTASIKTAKKNQKTT